MRAQSLAQTHFIVTALVNGKVGNFLLDTGARTPLIDSSQQETYKVEKYKRYNKQLVGLGGNNNSQAYITNVVIQFYGKPLSQFVMVDLSQIRQAIVEDSKVSILGIISLPQMQRLGIKLDTQNMMVEIP